MLVAVMRTKTCVCNTCGVRIRRYPTSFTFMKNMSANKALRRMRLRRIFKNGKNLQQRIHLPSRLLSTFTRRYNMTRIATIIHLCNVATSHSLSDTILGYQYSPSLFSTFQVEYGPNYEEQSIVYCSVLESTRPIDLWFAGCLTCTTFPLRSGRRWSPLRVM